MRKKNRERQDDLQGVVGHEAGGKARSIVEDATAKPARPED
ncbi:MAG: hypothetical protein RR034_00235 [Bacteroidales bacterium]